MTKRKSSLIASIPVLLIFAICEIYIRTTPKTYEIRSEIMLERHQLSAPEYLGDLGSNRWVWIRNGLATKELILSDDILEKILKNNPKIIETDNSHSKNYQNLRKHIDIIFKGADIYAFSIKIRSKDPDSAISASNIIIAAISEYELKEPIKTYKSTIQNLKSEADRLKKIEEDILPNLQKNRRRLKSLNSEIDRIERTMHQIKIAEILLKSEGKSRIKIIRKPKTHHEPIWPNSPSIRGLATLIGLTIYLLIWKILRTE